MGSYMLMGQLQFEHIVFENASGIQGSSLYHFGVLMQRFLNNA